MMQRVRHAMRSGRRDWAAMLSAWNDIYRLDPFAILAHQQMDEVADDEARLSLAASDDSRQQQIRVGIPLEIDCAAPVRFGAVNFRPTPRTSAALLLGNTEQVFVQTRILGNGIAQAGAAKTRQISVQVA